MISYRWTCGTALQFHENNDIALLDFMANWFANENELDSICENATLRQS